MTTDMGPPPARTPTTAATTTTSDADVTTDTEPKPSMGLPPQRSECPSSATDPETPTETNPTSEESPSATAATATTAATAESSSSSASGGVPYSIPEWSGPPPHEFYLEVLKDGTIIDSFDVCEKGAYMFGRVGLCDFVLEHPTISRFHAVLQFKRSGEAYLYDLGSTHGTFVNKSQVEKRVYVDLGVGDVIRFGCSSRLYIFQGPPNLMPPEVDRKALKDAKIRQEMLDREASLNRARREASLADGISWGMGEDAIEEEEDGTEEVTWQNYKGQLTDKQEKTREKIIKRSEKITHMRKEIDAIRAKDIAQGGLTQGQQTQIARNEQRITQLLEELESLEETLNESIQESLGARSGKSHSRRTGTTEEEDDPVSDDDDFYDRTKKPAKQNASENQSVETVDSLIDKRDAIMKKIDEKKELLSVERNKLASETAADTEAGDALDTFMSDLSSQLVFDKTAELEKELSSRQTELDRIYFLLKIADPSGEATKKRDSRAREQKPNKAELPIASTRKQPPTESKINNDWSRKPEQERIRDSVVTTKESNNKPENEIIALDATEGKKESAAYTAVKAQWLGAVHNRNMEESKQQDELNVDESDQFVDYKDRQKILHPSEGSKLKSEIESASSGLIVRKRKEVVKSGPKDDEIPEQSTSNNLEIELQAEDAVALLLKHKRGYHAEDEEEMYSNQEAAGRSKPGNKKKRAKRVLGPEKPSFLNTKTDDETWVPPEGQSGDGRTSLNDRYGY